MGGGERTLWGGLRGPPGEERTLRWQKTLVGCSFFVEGELPLSDQGVRQSCWFWRPFLGGSAGEADQADTHGSPCHCFAKIFT